MFGRPASQDSDSLYKAVGNPQLAHRLVSLTIHKMSDHTYYVRATMPPPSDHMTDKMSLGNTVQHESGCSVGLRASWESLSEAA